MNGKAGEINAELILKENNRLNRWKRSGFRSPNICIFFGLIATEDQLVNVLIVTACDLKHKLHLFSSTLLVTIMISKPTHVNSTRSKKDK